MSDSTFVWYDLMTTDLEAAKAFYTAVAGYSYQSVEGDKPYDMFVGARGPIGGLMDLPQEAIAMGAPPHWLAYIQVADIEASTARATELGATELHRFNVDSVGLMAIMNGPMDVPGGDRVAQCMDPEGASFALHSFGA